MTDKTDLIREIHEYVTTHGGENTATHLLVQAASAIQTQAAELEAVGAGGVQALSAAPAGFVPVAAFDRLHAHAESLAARLLAASPTPPAEQAAPKAAPAPLSDDVVKDAALWHWLAEYLVGTRTDLDDEIVASETVNDLRKLVEAAIKQGATT